MSDMILPVGGDGIAGGGSVQGAVDTALFSGAVFLPDL